MSHSRDVAARLIQQIREHNEEVRRILARPVLSIDAVSAIAAQLNQANNCAQQLKGLMATIPFVSDKG